MTAIAHAPSRPRSGEELRNGLLMALTFLVLLGLGWLVKSLEEGRATTFATPDGAITIDYPATWVTGMASEPGTLLEAYDAKALSTHHPTLRIQSSATRGGQSLFDASTSMSLRRSRTLREYKELSSQEVTFAGQPAIQVEYGFVADPSVGAGQAAMPSLVRATDLIVLHGGQLLVFTTESEAGNVERYRSSFDRILRSARLG